MPESGMDPMTLAMLLGNSGDPSAPDPLQVMRKYALASQLQNMALGGPTQPQQLGLEGKYPHAARVGVLSAAAPLVEALMARQGFKTAGPAMAGLYGKAAGMFGDQQVPGTPLQATSPASDPNIQSVQPLVQRLPRASLEQTVQASQPQTVHSPMNPLGLPPNLALQAWLKDPAKYAELIAGTPEWRTALAANGGNAGAAMRQLQSEAAKKGTIELRSGGTAMIPDGQGGYTRVRAPNLPPGFEPQYDAQGNYVGTQAAPGLAQGEGEVARAKELGETSGKINILPTQGGGTSASLGIPPGMGAPPQNQFFQPQQPSGVGAPPTQPQTKALPPDPLPDSLRVPNVPGGYGAPSISTKADLETIANERNANYKTLGAAAASASQNLFRISEAQKAIGGANMGPMSEQMTTMGGTLHQLFPSMFSGEAATNTQVLNKNLVQSFLPLLRQTFGPRLAASEVQLYKNLASPNAEQTMEAASYLLKTQALASRYEVQKFKDYQAFVANGGDPRVFEGDYATTHSLQQYALQHDSGRQASLAREHGVNIPPAAFDRLAANPSLKSDFVSQYKYEPPGY